MIHRPAKRGSMFLAVAVLVISLAGATEASASDRPLEAGTHNIGGGNHGTLRSVAEHDRIAVVGATDVTASGTRAMLGLDIGDSEGEMFRARFRRAHRASGTGVRLVI